MFNRKITFFAADSELEFAIPVLVRKGYDFAVQCVDVNKKEGYSVTVDYQIKDQVARILYSRGLNEGS